MGWARPHLPPHGFRSVCRRWVVNFHLSLAAHWVFFFLLHTAALRALCRSRGEDQSWVRRANKGRKTREKKSLAGGSRSFRLTRKCTTRGCCLLTAANYKVWTGVRSMQSMMPLPSEALCTSALWVRASSPCPLEGGSWGVFLLHCLLTQFNFVRGFFWFFVGVRSRLTTLVLAVVQTSIKRIGKCFDVTTFVLIFFRRFIV